MSSKIISIFSVLILATSINAQVDSVSWRAAYLEFDRDLFPSGYSIGATLVSAENWFVAGRMNWLKMDAPQYPDDFRKPTYTYEYTGPPRPNGSGNSELGFTEIIYQGLEDLFNSGYNSYDDGLYGDEKLLEKQKDDTRKYIRQFSFTAGLRQRISQTKIRLRAEVGVARLKIQEPVNFEFVPDSVEEQVGDITLTITSGYLYEVEERKETGLTLRTGVEYLWTDLIGLTAGFNATFAGGEKIYGLNLGVLLGVLK